MVDKKTAKVAEQPVREQRDGEGSESHAKAKRLETPDLLPFSDAIRVSDSALGKSYVDVAYFDADLEVRQANRLVDGLSADQLNQWQNFQSELADAKDNPERYQQLIEARNKQFPAIETHLENAAEHVLRGEKMVNDYNRKEFLKTLEKQFGPGAALKSRMYLTSNDLSSAELNREDSTAPGDKSRDALSELEYKTFNRPYYPVALQNGRSASVSGNGAKVEFAWSGAVGRSALRDFMRRDEPSLSSRWAISETQRPSLLDGERNYFHDVRFAADRIDSILRSQGSSEFRLESYWARPESVKSESYDEEIRRSVRRELETINHPNYVEAAEFRAGSI